MSVYVKSLDIFMLLTSWNESPGFPMEVPFDVFVERIACRIYTHKTNNCG
jgi:hypothetical protein